MRSGLIIFFVLILLSWQAVAQKKTWVKVRADTFALDSLSLLPNSLKISEEAQKKGLQLRYDFSQNLVWFEGDLSTLDSVEVSYQTLPFSLTNKRFKRDPQLYDSTDFYDEAFLRKNRLIVEEPNAFLDLPGLQKNGSITRGVSLGNNQNVFVNSALNLQLEGPISDELTLTASITDQNVPFQPEGNTQQLQEFDRIFVQLAHEKGSLSAGDVVLRQVPNYFLKYYKNVQGGLLSTNYELAQGKAQTRVGAALSKGKFASIQVEALEGVQGPYRLTGPNGERFIIILANSEKVFIDGKQLTRGYDYDYIIDYNQAEITFNSNVIITQFTRIRVDFEYAERNYGRSILAADHQQAWDKWESQISLYREADNPLNPVGVELSEADQQALSESGDQQGVAFINGADSTGFLTGQVMYARRDSTTLNATYNNIFVYSTNAENALYRVSFSRVGNGNGDYIQSESTINGQVYQWVEPINGVPQGDYAPLRVLPTPLKKQMTAFSLAYKPREKEKIYIEAALSEEDRNRYSPLDDTDNQGQAFKLGYQNLGQKINFLENYEWLGALDLEWNSQNFRPIDRFRSIEYNRDWSINSQDTSQIEERILNTQLGIRRNEENQLIYQISLRQRNGEAEGWQQQAQFAQEFGRFLLKTKWFALDSKQSLFAQRSRWQRLESEIAYRSKFSTWGYQFLLDKNRVLRLNSDSVVSTAMNFEEHVLYWQSPDTSKVRFRADYHYRYDFRPIEGVLQKGLRSQMANLRLNSRLGKWQSLNLILSYRNLEELILPDSSDLNQDNLMGRVDWNAQFLAQHIRSELSYSSATGRELQREFIYLPVTNNEGTHTWRDENNDNVQDLNEFYLAINPDERNFIKVFVPTDNFVKAFLNNFSYRLNWTAPRNWRKAKGWKAFLGKYSGIFAWTINRRITDESLRSRLLPFAQLEETAILSTQENLRSTIFFNRGNPRYGFDVNYQQSRQKQLLTNGFEQRDNEVLGAGLRFNLGKNFNFRLEGTYQELGNTSDFLLDRNYLIFIYRGEPEIAFQPNRNFRLIASFALAEKYNRFAPESQEAAKLQQARLEVRWNKLSKRNLLLNLRYIRLDYNAEANTALAYEMLEALQPGDNWTWSVNWQQSLANGLQLTLNYEGRKSANQPTVNVGRVQLTALF